MNKTKKQNQYLVVKISCMLLTAFIITGFQTSHAFAASGLKIYDYSVKKTLNYTDKQIKVTYNGAQIGNSKTPGILKNGVSLVSYQDIFGNPLIDAECSYDAARNKVTITKYGKTIVMTIGNRNATVNGKTVTMMTAPLKIKYSSANTTKVLVPSRFVAENLGISYNWYSTKNVVSMEKKTLQLSYNGGKKFEYTATQGQVTIDGKKVTLGDMPSIIMNNTAMLRLKKVFADSIIKATYQYNSADKSITIKKNENTLVMKLGSTTGMLNGNPIALDTAPVSVKNYKLNKSFIMVPGSITASCLGYDYSWNRENASSTITTRKQSNHSSSNTGIGAELGDEGMNNVSEKIIFTQNGTSSNVGKSSDCYELNTGMVSSGIDGRIYSPAKDNDTTYSNTERYVVTSDTPFEKVTSTKSGRVITVKAEDKNCSDSTTPISSDNVVSSIRMVNNLADKSVIMNLDLLTEEYSYDISLSKDGYSLYITIYLNTLSSVTIGTNSNGDYITFNCLSTSKPMLTKEGNITYIDLPFTKNSIGDLNQVLSGTKYINLFSSMSLSDKTRFILTSNNSYDTETIAEGSKCTIYFKAVGAPTIGVSPSAPGGTNTPAVIDKSKYEIVIPKPAGISSNMITDEDFYYNNKFVIRIPGNNTAFYNSKMISKSSSMIKDISVSVNSSNETEIIITTSMLQGYEYVSDNDNIYVNIGNPREIYKNIVVLDAGHGGAAKGAQYFGTAEKDINFQILYTIGRKYFNSNPSKLKVYYTRSTDVDMTLSNRAAYASKVGADLFVSLHMNAVAANAEKARGTEVYYSTNNNKPNSAGLTSKEFASIMVESLTSALGSGNRGAKSQAYTVVHRNTVPAILIELGFLSNKNDHALLADAAYQENAAKTIYETLLEVFDNYPIGR